MEIEVSNRESRNKYKEDHTPFALASRAWEVVMVGRKKSHLGDTGFGGSPSEAVEQVIPEDLVVRL